MHLPILGIDIAKDKFDVILLQSDKSYHRVFANRSDGFAQLQAWLTQHGVSSVHACLEATGTYGEAVAEFLYDAGHTVSLVNPAQIKAFGESELSRNKTDKSDAGVIARFCLKQQPRAWSPPPPEARELRALVRRLESLQDMRQQEANRLASGVGAQVVINSLQETLTFLDRAIEKIEQQIQDHIERHPQLKAQRALLTSIQGIGDKTAAVLMAEYRDLHAYASARAMVAYAGLNPQHRESGKSVRGKPRLSKKGSPRLRKALYWPAIVAMTHNPAVRLLCERLRGRGKPSMVIIGAAMRKLLHIVYGVLKSGQPFDPNYSQIGA